LYGVFEAKAMESLAQANPESYVKVLVSQMRGDMELR